MNDKDGMVSNFWRALKHDPEAVAEWADNPVNENDLHARHIWLVNQLADFVPRLEADPDFYDAKIAGWWVWGINCWIGGGFCSGNGPWHVEDGRLVNTKTSDDGVCRKRPHLGNAGHGVKRERPHLGNAGHGVKRERPHLGNAGQGVNRPKTALVEYMQSLADRLRNVRVCCGDWQRICGPSPTFKNGMTGVFLDPPYSAEAGRDNDLYRVEDDSVAHRCRDWAIEQGANPLMRIALCGYEGEHEMPADWECVAWKANGGYSSLGDGTNKNRHRERIWFSPACIRPELTLF